MLGHVNLVLDDVEAFVLVKPGSDGGGDSAGAPCRSADVGQWTGNVAAPEVVFAAVGAIRSQQ